MKNSNISLGFAAGILFFLGCCFKIMHLPFASILIMAGSLLGIVFMILYLINNTKTLSAGIEKSNGVIGSITMAFVLLGFIFKILHWPGSNILVFIGHALLLLFSFTLFIDAYKETNVNKKNIKALAAFSIMTLMSILIILGLGVLLNN